MLYSLSKMCVVPETVTVLFCGFGVGYGIVALQWTKPAMETPLPPSLPPFLYQICKAYTYSLTHVRAQACTHTHTHTHTPRKLYSSP